MKVKDGYKKGLLKRIILKYELTYFGFEKRHMVVDGLVESVCAKWEDYGF